MKFRTRIKLNLALGVACVIFGACILGVGLIQGSKREGIEFFLVSGAALALMGLLRLFQYVSALRDKKKLEQLEIQMSDERALLLAYRSGYTTFVFSAIGLYLYSLYLLLVDSPLFESVSLFCSISVCIYLVCYIVIKKIN